jgi:hypothetical protein
LRRRRNWLMGRKQSAQLLFREVSIRKRARHTHPFLKTIRM